MRPLALCAPALASPGLRRSGARRHAAQALTFGSSAARALRGRQSPEKRRKPSQEGRTGRVPPLFSHALAVHSLRRHTMPASESPLARQGSPHAVRSSSAHVPRRHACCEPRHRAGQVVHACGGAGRRQALRNLPEGQLAARQQAGPRAARRGQPPARCRRRFPGAPRASFAHAVVFDANDAEAWTGPRPRAARHQARPGQRALRAARQRLGRRAGTPTSAPRPRRPRRPRCGCCTRRSSGAPTGARPSTRCRPASPLDKTAEAQEALEKLVAEHGFRIVEYKVDADAAQPRLCIQFSERLAPGTVDWAQYFKVDGKDPQAVNAEARQICLDGFAHGKRYEVQVRAGLPSAIGGETLLKTAELAVYVQATARRRCAPRGAATCCPTAASRASRWSRSTPRRSTSRSIASATAASRRRCRAAISRSRSRPMSSARSRSSSGAQVYSGELAVASRLNEDVTTAFPDRRGDPAPAARRLRAGRLRRRTSKDEDDGRTRHAVVHRLRPRPHRHQRRRRHPRLRALAGHRHARSSTPTCACWPATTRCWAPPRPTAAAMCASIPA